MDEEEHRALQARKLFSREWNGATDGTLAYSTAETTRRQEEAVRPSGSGNVAEEVRRPGGTEVRIGDHEESI